MRGFLLKVIGGFLLGKEVFKNALADIAVKLDI